MKDVKITELRQNLSAYLRRVRRGERFKVTSRGKVVAELSPPAVEESEATTARALLRGSVLRYDRPLEPIIEASEWDVNR